MFLICIKCKKKKKKNNEKYTKDYNAGEARGCPCRAMAPREKLAFLMTLCFSLNCTVDSNLLLPPSELARGHTQRAADCHFPTETRQGG